ncbi:uncharacterized protein LOC135492817 isoform X2 [Lineus longissimus]|uniref:uncharacterized protein LOC135492817 isoform X2 n=1 Tax=Lineus longissimus TaxID=88925 RepID=UPI002B4C6869
MPSNVEIKALVPDIQRLHCLAKKLSRSEGTLIEQEDTFFNVSNGRLKLRVLKSGVSMLIFYKRSDQFGPKVSDFHITEIQNPQDLKASLGLALGIKGDVKKRRMLYMVGQTRLHVDSVEGLGDFMELEVMMQPKQTTQEGETIAKDLMNQLEVSPENLIEGAYMDMLLKKANKCNGHS